MKQIFKQKFYGKLVSFLKYKRNKKIRTFISFSKKKIDFNIGIGRNPKKRSFQQTPLKGRFSLKKVNFFDFIPLTQFADNSDKIGSPVLPSGGDMQKDVIKGTLPVVPDILSASGKLVNKRERSEANVGLSLGIERTRETNIENNEMLKANLGKSYKVLKKKYKLNSFLFNILCQYTRNRGGSFLGKDIIFRYNTIPYRLSLSRFIGNKILHSYYKNLNKKSFLTLRKKIFLNAKRSKQIIYKTTQNVNLIKLDKKETVKNLIFNLEKRLYSSLFRLLQFKPLYTKKFIKSKKFNKRVGSF
jgi:hypothetical protein